MQILFVLGTRPNIVKAAPLYHALARRSSTPTLLYTGQHHDYAMLGSFAETFDLPAGHVLNGAPSANERTQYIAQLSSLIQERLQELCPNLVIVFGDVNSSLAGAMAARALGLRLAHVESGLRSGDLTMPEELNRIEIDRLAHLHFVTEQSGVENLLHEGVQSGGIFHCGNTMIDALMQNLPKARKEKLPIAAPFIWLSIHRPANTDTYDAALRSVTWIEALCSILPVFMPLHPRLRNRLTHFGLFEQLEGIHGLVIGNPQPYLTNLALLDSASLIVTDSGGVQEEAAVLRKPCITLRTTTERPSTIQSGLNRLLIDPTPADLILACNQAMMKDSAVDLPPLPTFWDGRAADRIAETILS